MPELLPGEAELGFPPLRMLPAAAAEPAGSCASGKGSDGLGREARVNYSKLMTVEYNKVLWIGELAEDGKKLLQEAVNKCWMVKRQYSGCKSEAVQVSLE